MTNKGEFFFVVSSSGKRHVVRTSTHIISFHTRVYAHCGHSDYDKLLHSGVPFVEIPCGKCIECRLQYSRSWADRCVIEAKKYDHNYFVTLTYDDFYLPKNRSLSKSDFKNFIKYLRKLIPNSKIRFFGCGEYGTNPSSGDPGLRPHYLYNSKLYELYQNND